MTSLHDLHAQPRRRPTTCTKGVTTAHFGELRDPLVDFINGSEVIVGCVAWVTERTILAALAKRPVALVVQKENWWKKTDTRGKALAERYVALTGGLPAAAFPGPLARSKAILAPISCLGHGAAGQMNPLMHHKFIVRCSMQAGPDGLSVLVPTAVWTGSFNFSANANSSLENAVEIHDPAIAAGYLAEFALAASISEGMNWRFTKPSSNLGRVFVAPIGTTTTRAATPRAASTSRKRRPAKKAAAQKPGIRKPAVKKAAAKRPVGKKRPGTRPAAKKTTAKVTSINARRAKPAVKKSAPKKKSAA